MVPPQATTASVRIECDFCADLVRSGGAQPRTLRAPRQSGIWVDEQGGGKRLAIVSAAWTTEPETGRPIVRSRTVTGQSHVEFLKQASLADRRARVRNKGVTLRRPRGSGERRCRRRRAHEGDFGSAHYAPGGTASIVERHRITLAGAPARANGRAMPALVAKLKKRRGRKAIRRKTRARKPLVVVLTPEEIALDNAISAAAARSLAARKV